MATRGTGPPLDERAYHRPEIIGWWVNEMGGQAMDENMIHRYLTESPFFDYTTKNGLIFTQARTNHAADQLVRNRREFEDQLARQNGTEYMIVGEPQPVPGGVPEGLKNGMYLIRKQDRKRNRMADGSIAEELTTLGTYYVVGEVMYQARSVGDIVGNRVLSAATSLSKFFDKAASLPNFSPTSGYTYVPQQASKSSATGAGSTSPSRSRDGSVMPSAGGMETTGSVRSGSVLPDGQSSTTTTAAVDSSEARLLEQTMNMLDSFGDEYTDENPILGEPGHFSFTSSTAAVKKRRAEEETQAAEKLKQQEQSAAPATASVFSRLATPKAEKMPSPPPVMTEAKALKERERDRRGSRSGDKIRRKKSRANAQTPTTPGSVDAAGSFSREQSYDVGR